MIEKLSRPSISAVLRLYGADISPSACGWQRIKCCFHDDKIPSAQVNENMGRWGCFTCGFYEDGIDVLMRQEGLDFRGAVEFARERFGTGDPVPRGRERHGLFSADRTGSRDPLL